MTCPSDCRDSLQRQRKMWKNKKRSSENKYLYQRKHLQRRVSGFYCAFFCFVGEIWTCIINVTDLHFNSCTRKPHLNITSTVIADLIIHLSGGIVKVPDHLKPSRQSFFSPPWDSRRTERAEINKYIAVREFKGARMAFLLSSCQQRVNNGNIKMCRGAATHSCPPLPTRRIKAEREKLLIAVRKVRVSGVLQTTHRLYFAH